MGVYNWETKENHTSQFYQKLSDCRVSITLLAIWVIEVIGSFGVIEQLLSRPECLHFNTSIIFLSILKDIL